MIRYITCVLFFLAWWCVNQSVCNETGAVSGGADVGRIQGQGGWHDLRLVLPADTVSEAHGSGTAALQHCCMIVHVR